MVNDPLLARARQVWTDLAATEVTFPVDGGVEVAASAGSSLCPPGWTGVVVLGESAIVTVPAVGLVGVVREALVGVPVEAMTDVDRLRTDLSVAEVLGPAELAYLAEEDFRPVGSVDVVELPPDHDDLAALLAAVTTEDVEECGLMEITSSAFAVRAGSEVVAAAGYRHWPGSVAHLSVLTASGQRGRGLGRAAAAAAVEDALAHRLLPQWRSRPAPSRRVATALGFRRLGTQLSLRIEG